MCTGWEEGFDMEAFCVCFAGEIRPEIYSVRAYRRLHSMYDWVLMCHRSILGDSTPSFDGFSTIFGSRVESTVLDLGKPWYHPLFAVVYLPSGR